MGRTAGYPVALLRWGSVVLVLMLEVVAVLWLPIQPVGWGEIVITGVLFLVPLAGVILAGVAWGRWITEHERADALLARTREEERRMAALLQLHRDLVDANQDTALLEAMLDLMIETSGALGCSFMPLDEWGQPLQAITRGNLPETDLLAWNKRLMSDEVRHRCRDCLVLHAPTTSTCPLADNPFKQSAEIVCLPLRHGDLMLGMLNLYLPAGVTVEEDLRVFLEGVLTEMGLIMETIRLRNRELTTLRHLQFTRSSQTGLNDLLQDELADARRVLDADYAGLMVQGSERVQPKVFLQNGGSRVVSSQKSQKILKGIIESGDIPALFAERDASLLAAPMVLDGRNTIGALLVVCDRPGGFDKRQERFLNAMANQCAYLVQNERLRIELEYKAVLNERTRLAREIHDGLAQTLAFLKLQATQMLNMLSIGETEKLKELLNASHQALADAYLETRQTIDSLRTSPDEGLQSWLEQTALEFEANTHLPIHLELRASSGDLAIEVQLQLIRIVQEALNNVRKHAHANEVWISLKQWKSDLILEVRDDGGGFAPEDVPGLTQYGLRGMRERSELIGADFQIISTPAEGTTVRLRLPYPMEATTV
jgi:two-component system nitrate/nitrite sensor histidine kinase NarX